MTDSTLASGPQQASAAPRRGRNRIASHRSIGWRVYSTVFSVAAMVLPYSRVSIGGDVIDLTFLITAGALVIAHAGYSGLVQRGLRRHSYGRYVRIHPDHVQEDGRVRCCHCGERHIVQHDLSGFRYLAHACAGCRQLLFFRPERRAARTPSAASEPSRWEGAERRRPPPPAAR